MSQNTECIKLNVGGALFVTSKETVMSCESSSVQCSLEGYQ